jgi:uncharacterized protein
MTPEAVAQYLQHNPKFFDEYAEMLAQVHIPHPHGGRAISLPERQMLTLRERVKSLEATIADLVETGRSNDALSEKMHRLMLALMRLPKDQPERVVQTLDTHLREDFSIPHAAFRLWGVKSEHAALDEAAHVSDTLKHHATNAASSFRLPYCGALANLQHDEFDIGAEVALWFGEAAPHLKSVALMSVYGPTGGGLLALASEDVHRFYAGMGTLYLERLADALSAALNTLFNDI